MTLTKEKMIKIINEQPDDSTYNEILQELSFINMINNGLEDSKNSRLTSNNDLKKEIQNW